MRAGRKLGYAAAIAGGLLLAGAWAAAAQNPCTPVFGDWGLVFTNCVTLDQPLPDRTAAETACNNLYTQGYWSQPTEEAGQHEQREADLIRAGLRRGDWDTGVVGGIDWQFDAATETVETPWGYEDPAIIGQSIATLDTLITNLTVVLTVVSSDPAMVTLLQESRTNRDLLDDLADTGVPGSARIPYYANLPDWVDKNPAGSPAFDPADPVYQASLTPQPSSLSTDVGHFTDRPPRWDPTLTPALEILKCQGWSATRIIKSPTKFDNAGIKCPDLRGDPPWELTDNPIDYISGTCRYERTVEDWVLLPKPPPHNWVLEDVEETTREEWTCKPLEQSISIGTDPDPPEISETLPGYRRERSRNVWSCEYTFPQSLLQNFSSQLEQFNVDLPNSSKPAVTIGHDILDDTFGMPTTPVGWAVRWIEHAPPGWDENDDPLCVPRTKPCWPTFTPDVRMSPRLDTLLVGTPTWVWMDNVRESCLPFAEPEAPAPDCERSRAVWEAWPRDEGDPNMWRHEQLHTQAGNIWRAVFPQKISIELTPTTPGAPVRPPYECWTAAHGRTVAAGKWAPGQRPFESHPGGPGQPARTGPLATPLGPLNPGVGDCTFVHDVAGPHTATITIHWIGKEGDSSPPLPGTPGRELVWDDPPAGQEPPNTVQTVPVPVVFHELHTIPGA